MEAVRTEVDIAVRELRTSYLEIGARSQALAAAEAEANTIEQRWKRMVDGNGSAALNLESLLRAQERVTQTERDYLTSILTYNLAMVNLKRANGTLLNSENVNVDVGNEDGCKSIEIDKAGPSVEPLPVAQASESDFFEQGYIGQAVPTEAVVRPQTMGPASGEIVPATNELQPAIVPNLSPTGVQNHVGGFNIPSEFPQEFVPAQESAPAQQTVPAQESVPEKVAPKREATSDYFRKK